VISISCLYIKILSAKQSYTFCSTIEIYSFFSRQKVFMLLKNARYLKHFISLYIVLLHHDNCMNLPASTLTVQSAVKVLDCIFIMPQMTIKK